MKKINIRYYILFVLTICLSLLVIFPFKTYISQSKKYGYDDTYKLSEGEKIRFEEIALGDDIKKISLNFVTYKIDKVNAIIQIDVRNNNNKSVYKETLDGDVLTDNYVHNMVIRDFNISKGDKFYININCIKLDKDSKVGISVYNSTDLTDLTKYTKFNDNFMVSKDYLSLQYTSVVKLENKVLLWYVILIYISYVFYIMMWRDENNEK